LGKNPLGSGGFGIHLLWFCCKVVPFQNCVVGACSGAEIGAAPLAAHFALPNRPRLPGRILVFKLGGTDTAPPYPIRPKPTLALTGIASSGDEKAGFSLYNANCINCHGPSVSGRYLPDLNTSPIIASQADFASVVLGGAKKANGMASFAKYLDAGQAESIRAYILKEARAAQAGG